MEENYCYGCGYKLQNKYEDKLGYIKLDVMKKEVYCMRCYNMKFRNQTPKVFLENKDYWDLFDEIISKDALYILVVDIFNIEGTLIQEMVTKLKGKKIIVVLNKRDLLPKLIKDNKIYKYIKGHYLLQDIKILDMLVVSANKKYNIDLLLDKINDYKKSDVYLIGSANVGKSSLINALVSSVMDKSQELISTSYYGGTTLGMIKIPFGDGDYLIDTPGIVSEEQLYFNNDSKILKAIVAQKEIRPKIYQLNAKQTIFVTGFLQLDYIKGKKQGFSVYVAQQITPHRTSLKNSEDFRKQHIYKDIIVPPFTNDKKNLDFEKHILKIKGKNIDIVINDLCFINLKNIEGEIEVHITIPKIFNYHIRAGLI